MTLLDVLLATLGVGLGATVVPLPALPASGQLGVPFFGPPMPQGLLSFACIFQLALLAPSGELAFSAPAFTTLLDEAL